jgi:selenocysteine-specific elongation factor
LRLRTPVAAPPGGAFVLRRLSPKDVLGGGRLDAMETPDAGDASGDDIAAPSPEAERVAAALRAAGIAGESAERLGALANVRAALAAEILEGFVAEGRAIRVARPDALVDAQVAAELFARIDAALAEGETSRPWSLGVTSVALARKLGEPESNVARLLFALADDGRLALRNGYFSTPGFEPRLTAEQRAFFNEKLSLDSAAPNVPFALDELTAAVKTSRIEGLAQALDTLFATGALVKVGDAVYRRSQIARIREALEKAATAKGTITPAEFRDAIGTSRKFAVPLLEFFDATGITLRSGDARVLRQSVKA